MPGVAEVSLFVGEPWRRSRIGTALLQATEHWAREMGCSALRLHCLRSNWPMRAFLEREGARLDLIMGEIVAEIGIEAVTRRRNVS